ncbi:MAG: hypothetical protein PHN82_11815 [bacterium]|nr:hypothetical protein [bacterium]
MNRNIVCRILLAASLAAGPAAANPPANRQQRMADRKRVIDFATRHGVLIKGMTKGEVLKIYGRPDKRFNFGTGANRVEQWTYYFPRRRSVFPWKDSPFTARFCYLYFRDDLLVNFE